MTLDSTADTGIVSVLGGQDRALLTQQLGEHNGAEHHIPWHWKLVATGCVGHVQVYQLPTVLLTQYLLGQQKKSSSKTGDIVKSDGRQPAC